jgi:superfamily I DNA/RNA helicase
VAERIWSQQQIAIFEWFKSSMTGRTLNTGTGAHEECNQNLVVRARAGTGKTTTILEAISYAPEESILFCAFNKRIADHIKYKLTNPRAEAKTLHSIGLSFITERWGRLQIDDNRADDLTAKALATMDIDDLPIPVSRVISKLHSKAREIRPHASEPADLFDIVDDYDCDVDDEYEEMGFGTAFIIEVALKAMVIACEKPKITDPTGRYRGGVDFADMIFLPIRNKWLRPRWRLVVVDEAQDMSASQLEIAQGICSGRMCLVGDDRQAIYGFRGADSNSIDRLKSTLKAAELSLNTTYRCGHAIVRHAAKLVPDFNAHHENHEGVIRLMRDIAPMVMEAAPGDFVLSRKNAPLASVAMAFIRANKRVCIVGKDIGKGLEALAKKLATGAAERSIPMLLQKIQSWAEKESKRAMASTRSETQAAAKVDAIWDKAETLTFLCEGVAGVRELLARIQVLFEEGDASTLVTCSSIHKAKGLEAERVYVLVDTLYALPKKGKIAPSRLREEENLDYVASTRAIRELVLVGQSAGAPAQMPLAEGDADMAVNALSDAVMEAGKGVL